MSVRGLWIFVFWIFAHGFLFSGSLYAKSTEFKDNIYEDKYAAFVMDADTGLILYHENAEELRHPASLTKAMTLLMLFDALENRKISRNTRIPISRHAASMEPSKLDLPVGSSIRVDDAIDALVTKSANDIAAAIAEKLGGSERNFARMMTQKAKDIGMQKTVFTNASGLPDDRQVTTARDMAKMGRYLIKRYPNYYKKFAIQKFSYRGKTYRNHNRLMETYDGMDGIKTGYIRASGFNLLASVKKNDRRLVAVIFGGKSASGRNTQMEKLLNDGFARLEQIKYAIGSDIAPAPQRKPIMNNLNMAQNFKQGSSDNTSTYAPATKTIVPSARLTPFQKMTPPYTIDSPGVQGWSIQIGAFRSRDSSNAALYQIRKQLPLSYRYGKDTIAPMQTGDSWLYRARLSGYTHEDAQAACKHIQNGCLVIAPENF